MGLNSVLMTEEFVITSMTDARACEVLQNIEINTLIHIKYAHLRSKC